MVYDLSDMVNWNHSNANTNRMLTWKEIKLMEANKVSFGSHTVYHNFLDNQLTKDMQITEISKSKTLIESKLNHSIIGFAYPGGKISNQVKSLICCRY